MRRARLFAYRHAFVLNVGGRPIDVLSGHGIEQGMALCAAVGNRIFDGVYTSPMTRAWTTAVLIVNDRQKPEEIDGLGYLQHGEDDELRTKIKAAIDHAGGLDGLTPDQYQQAMDELYGGLGTRIAEAGRQTMEDIVRRLLDANQDKDCPEGLVVFHGRFGDLFVPKYHRAERLLNEGDHLVIDYILHDDNAVSVEKVQLVPAPTVLLSTDDSTSLH